MFEAFKIAGMNPKESPEEIGKVISRKTTEENLWEILEGISSGISNEGPEKKPLTEFLDGFQLPDSSVVTWNLLYLIVIDGLAEISSRYRSNRLVPLEGIQRQISKEITTENNFR